MPHHDNNMTYLINQPGMCHGMASLTLVLRVLFSLDAV